MRSIFGWDLPPGVTPNDIEEAMGDGEERSVTSELDAIINDPLVDEDGLTGKPYEDGETPISPEEAQEVIREMRKALRLPYRVDHAAQALANETGLEVDKSDIEEYQYLHGWEDGQASQDYWQRVLAGEE